MDAIEQLLKAVAYHLRGSGFYHLYVDCANVKARNTNAADLRQGDGGGKLCETCKGRLRKAVRAL
ncbi:MAG: hypothetical protein OXN90_16660 [Gemmatimonadota bacterium]|nr:hypothetical protein [Gemmatimonadota bacterium]